MIITRAKTLLLTAVLAAAPPPSFSGQFAGVDTFDFLFLDAGAGPAAMGGAFAAGGDDANVLAYNPAGLSFMTATHASLMHTQHFQGVTRQHLALAGKRGWGISVDYLRFGELSRTTLSNPDGAGLGDFAPSAMVAAFGFGRAFLPSVHYGASIKWIRETIDDARRTAWAGDFGIQWQISEYPFWRLGAAVQNIGSDVRFDATDERLPINFKVGTAYRFAVLGRPLGLLLDLNRTPNGRNVINTGLTTIFNDILTLRVGYNGRNDAGLGITAGFGLSFPECRIDYALTPFGALGLSHQFNVDFRWGKNPAPSSR